MKALIALLMLSTALPASALAQESEQDPVVKAHEDATARITAQTAQIQAQTANTQARLTQLGLTNSATGTTTIKEKGGELEAWMLSAQAIDKAAEKVVAVTASSRGTRPVVLLDATEAFDLSVYSVTKTRLDALSSRFTDLLGSPVCKAPASGGAHSITALALPALAPLAGAALSLLKTDTEIYGADGPTSSRLLVNAVAQRPGTWIVPSDLSQIPTGSPLAKQWDKLQADRGKLAACAARLTGEANKANLATVTASLAAFDAFETQAVTSGDGTSLIVQAIRAETIASKDPLVLRLFVEKSGGTILLRKNLWTALGAPAVGITGGAIVSWRLIAPTSGISTGGGLRCHTELSSLRAIQSGSVASRECVTSN